MDFEVIRDILIFWTSRNDTKNIRVYMEGFSMAKGKDRVFFIYIGEYLKRNYGIDNQLNGWWAQVDHYSYDHKLSWHDGFFKLLKEIFDRKEELGISETVNEDELFKHYEGPYINTEEEIDEAVLDNGLLVKKGSLLCLGDKIGDTYKKMRYYDPTLRNPSWELFYPSEKDFKYIDLYTKGDSDHEPVYCEKVRRIFSGSVVKIHSLAKLEGKPVAFAGPFFIQLEEAIEAKEIGLVEPYESINPKDFKSLEKTLKGYWVEKRVTPDRDSISRWCNNCFDSFNKDWHYYYPSLSGRWYKTEKHPDNRAK